MTWRIHFTAQDLARVRIGDTLGPLAETMFGLSQLGDPARRPAGLTRWRQRARALVTPEARPLTSLITTVDTVRVDLWTLTGKQTTIEDGIDALLGMPEEHVLGELEYFTRYNRLPESAWRVADPEGGAREQLASAAHTSYRALIEPYWTQVRAHLCAERMSRANMLLTGGVEHLLATLCPPLIRWRPPLLEVIVPRHADLSLGGRGLVLVPSLFVGERLALMGNLNGEEPLRLVFPVEVAAMPGAHLLTGDPDSPQTLSALMGRARAEALRRIADGCSTVELARHLAISPVAASEHATVLLQAGLIATRRQGNATWHTITPLGLALLEAA